MSIDLNTNRPIIHGCEMRSSLAALFSAYEKCSPVVNYFVDANLLLDDWRNLVAQTMAMITAAMTTQNNNTQIIMMNSTDIVTGFTVVL
jgi:hypothetical protein